MGEVASSWRRIEGDGLVHAGPCIVKAIVFEPHAGQDWADVYDGRDATSGEKFCRVEAKTVTTVPVNLGDGVLFGRGIYVDGTDGDVRTTVTFIPL